MTVQKKASVTRLKPELIVHIGPPKTGTTSLQVALEEPLPPCLDFLGAFRPRERNGMTGSHVLNDWCWDAVQHGSDWMDVFMRRVEDNTRRGITSIVVEEVILDSNNAVRWNHKIRKLAELAPLLGIVRAITLRHPLPAVFSLQGELSTGLGFVQRSTIFALILCHQCQVFNYRFLLEELRDAGFIGVHMISFDQMTRDGFNLSGMVRQTG